jgi:hypothetical protein
MGKSYRNETYSSCSRATLKLRPRQNLQWDVSPAKNSDCLDDSETKPSGSQFAIVMPKKTEPLVSVEQIDEMIHTIRGM